MSTHTRTRTRGLSRSHATSGFTLIEMIVVVFLLAIAMLGILAVFDASARINKSEQDVADAQGAVRYGVYQMTRAIRMAGSGGLFVTQAVLNAPDPQLAGITVASANGYDNVTGATVTDINTGVDIPVRDGTDMIEIRGVINSPLLAFNNGTECQTGVTSFTVPPITGTNFNLVHYNQDATNRPQFSAVDAYTAGVTAARPMFVFVSNNDDIHPGAAMNNAVSRYPQPTYNVGLIQGPTDLMGSSTIGGVNFANGVAVEFDTEIPSASGATASYFRNARHIGILDDLIYFIDNTDPLHPALAQGTRRGAAFDVVRLADDVEDMQIAYGVDTDANDALNRLTGTVAGTDTDANVSTQVNGDEWRPNVPGEAVYVATDFQAQQPPPAIFTHDANSAHFPRLHGVMVSLVAKSKDPDPTYRSANARGIVVMNTPVTVNAPYPDVAQYPTFSAEPQFRRRVQTIKINLRNYAFPG
jgi:prepilin-type N-terminal cleavage/methylation domain-containing protein